MLQPDEVSSSFFKWVLEKLRPEGKFKKGYRVWNLEGFDTLYLLRVKAYCHWNRYNRAKLARKTDCWLPQGNKPLQSDLLIALFIQSLPSDAGIGATSLSLKLLACIARNGCQVDPSIIRNQIPQSEQAVENYIL